MVSKLQWIHPLVQWQKIEDIKKLETTTPQIQEFYLVRSGAERGKGISRGEDLNRPASTLEENPIPEVMKQYAQLLDPHTKSTFVISSTAKSAIETATYFMDALKEKKLELVALQPTKELVERSVGEQAGKLRSGPEYEAKVAPWRALSAKDKFTHPEMQEMGYETFKAVAERVAGCLKRLRQEYPQATFFIFTHAHCIEAAVLAFKKEIVLSEEPGTFLPLEHLSPLEMLEIQCSGEEANPKMRLLLEEPTKASI